jgi:hypothetical protein
MMGKDKIRSYRISWEREQRIGKILKSLGKNWTWAINYGLDNVERRSLIFIQEELQRLNQAVLQRNTLLVEFQENVIQCNTKIEQRIKQFFDQGRDPDETDSMKASQDKFWVQTALETDQIADWDVGKFYAYARAKKKNVDIILSAGEENHGLM